MTETTYIIDLAPDGRNRYRHRHLLEKNKIVEFSIQYEAFIENEWHPIVRYDSAHRFAHRDVMQPDGTETKTTFEGWDFGQVLTFGERDLKQNWSSYRDSYERALERMKRRKRGKP